MSVRRHTFVVQIREPDRQPMVENVRTRERVLLDDVAEVGGAIARWLGEAPDGAAAEAPVVEGEGATVVGLPLPASNPAAHDGAPATVTRIGPVPVPPQGGGAGVPPAADEAAVLPVVPEAIEPEPAVELQADEPAATQLRRFSSPSGAD